LRETLQFAGAHLLTSLLAFNVGVEAGQLFVLALFVPALQLLFRYVVAERIGIIILSTLVAHTAWHWTADRWERLRETAGPAFGPGALVEAVPWLMLAAGAAGAAWLLATATRRRGRPAAGEAMRNSEGLPGTPEPVEERR
jgi:hypothetical protein